MKLALIIFADFPEGSGPSRRAYLLAKGLACLGHEVHVIVPQKFRSGPLFQELDGFFVHWGTMTTPVTWSRYTARIAARLATSRLLGQLLSDGLDWLILSNPSLDGLPFLLSARRHRTRVIATYDDLRARPQHATAEDRLRLAWLNTADVLLPRLTQWNLVTSSFLEERLQSIAPRIPTFLLPPLVDLEVFEPRGNAAIAFRRKYNLDNHTVISYLGTYWHVEGLRVLLTAVAQIVEAGECIRLVISGAAHEGLDCDDVSGLVQALGLDKVVIQTGWLATNDVVAAMSAADILVVPKLNDIANVAGMPAKLAEYLAMGRPVVVSRVGDIPLYLCDRQDALLCESGDVQSLKQTLLLAIHDSSLRNRLAVNARRTAQKHFDYRTVTAQLEAAILTP